MGRFPTTEDMVIGILLLVARTWAYGGFCDDFFIRLIQILVIPE